MAWSCFCDVAAAAAGVHTPPSRIAAPTPACFRSPPRVVRATRSAASLIARLGSIWSSMGPPGERGEAHGGKVWSLATEQPPAFEGRRRLGLGGGRVDGLRRRILARQHARPCGMTCLNRNDPRGRTQRRGSQVRSLAVVGRERRVLERNRRGGELPRVARRLPEPESRCFTRLAPERGLDKLAVGSLVARDNLRELTPLAAKPAVHEALGVEGHL